MAEALAAHIEELKEAYGAVATATGITAATGRLTAQQATARSAVRIEDLRDVRVRVEREVEQQDDEPQRRQRQKPRQQHQRIAGWRSSLVASAGSFPTA